MYLLSVEQCWLLWTFNWKSTVAEDSTVPSWGSQRSHDILQYYFQSDVPWEIVLRGFNSLQCTEDNVHKIVAGVLVNTVALVNFSSYPLQLPAAHDGSRNWLKELGHYDSCGRLGLSCWYSALGWTGLAYCRNLRNEPADGRSLSFCFLCLLN